MTTSRIDEETPLLPPAEGPVAITPGGSDEVTTPLPRLQIGILLLILLTEPICSQCIYPFINQVTPRSEPYPDPRLTYFQLVSELGITDGDEKKVGYYAGKQERHHRICTIDPESYS